MTKHLKTPRGRVRAEKVGDIQEQAERSKKRASRVRHFRVGEGVPPIPEMEEELIDMTNVLLGRVDPPIEVGVHTLHEVADAYYARAAELTMLLQMGERKGTVLRGSSHYKFRTGELRTFMDLAKRAAELGSRRLTAEQLRFEMEVTGRESSGD